MTREELLLQLRDIQPPPEPGWWLIAPGYLAIVTLLVGLFSSAWLLRRRQRVDRLATLARLELQAIRASYRQDQNVRLLAFKVSGWLKRVAILAFPGNRLQSVSGEPWLKFLDQSLGHNGSGEQNNSRFSQGCGRVFGAALYQANIDFDAEQIFALCEHWLNSITPRLQQRSRAQ
jgi:hypothetical protein